MRDSKGSHLLHHPVDGAPLRVRGPVHLHLLGDDIAIEMFDQLLIFTGRNIEPERVAAAGAPRSFLSRPG